MSVGVARATATTWVRRPWVWVVSAVVVVGVAGVAVVALRFAPLFQVEHIDVLGNSQVSADEVVAAADLPGGTALLALPIDQIESRVELLDAVASARVVRDWPDRVKIVVRERRPVGYAESVVGVGFVGSDGSIYRVQSQKPDDLPLLPTATGEPAQVGDSYSGGAGDIESAAFEVAVSLPGSLQRHIAEIDASSSRTVRLTFNDGVVVEWGSPTSATEKVTVVQALRQRPGWGKVFTVIDVTAPEAPALR